MNPIEGDVFLFPYLGHNYITIENKEKKFQLFLFIITYCHKLSKLGATLSLSNP